MGIINKLQLYKEEFEFIFSKKGSGVRRVIVTSALIEWQVFTLANNYLKKRGVIHKPESNQQYNQSMNILRVNKILSLKELEKIQNFRKERNKSIHEIFKDMTRPEWDRQNKVVIELGRLIVKELDKKLYG